MVAICAIFHQLETQGCGNKPLLFEGRFCDFKDSVFCNYIDYIDYLTFVLFNSVFNRVTWNRCSDGRGLGRTFGLWGSVWLCDLWSKRTVHWRQTHRIGGIAAGFIRYNTLQHLHQQCISVYQHWPVLVCFRPILKRITSGHIVMKNVVDNTWLKKKKNSLMHHSSLLDDFQNRF